MNPRILWADDEIDHLKSHLLFLESKGYDVTTVTNGYDAIEILEDNFFDIVFLDENMPGLTGLETLERIKETNAELPVVMITKSEEEMIMEEAIGQKISDYLIKPVNPNQILLTLRKNLEGRQLSSKKSFDSYRQNFAKLSMDLSACRDFADYAEYYKKLLMWESKLEDVTDAGIKEIWVSQCKEANQQFCKFVSKNYVDWFQPDDETPLLVHKIFQERVLPKALEAKKAGKKLYWLVIDNLRYDQWMTLRSSFAELFQITQEETVSSILPTATHYARNACFAGLMPSEIKKKHPQYWVDEDAQGSKNKFEDELLGLQLKRLAPDMSYKYYKVTSADSAGKVMDSWHSHKEVDMIALVYNFVDMLSHARTDMEVIKELAKDEGAYRSLTKSWFTHSPLKEFVRKIAAKGDSIVISTDHGSVRVKNPIKVVGDRETSTNLRYKQGRNLSFKDKEVFAVHNPDDIYLPKPNVSTSYIFSYSNDFMVYPNNYNKYVHMYEDTFQHGGVSLEEMILPLICLDAK